MRAQNLTSGQASQVDWAMVLAKSARAMSLVVLDRRSAESGKSKPVDIQVLGCITDSANSKGVGGLTSGLWGGITGKNQAEEDEEDAEE